ncbi:MAG: 2-hydroxyacyl-CoA dehydratase subunit D [Myxococcota bacterium]
MTKLASYKAMKETMMVYYLEAKNASHNNRPLAWITSGAPVEFLYAMDVIPIYPENHAAMCGTSRDSLKLIEAAEARGYPQDICSYARTDFGAYLTNGGPIMGLPKPDFLVCSTNICRTVVKWYEEVARNYDIPLIMIDMPLLHRGLNGEAVDYVVEQFDYYRERISEILGKPFDDKKFAEVYKLSMEATRYWNKILKLARNRPSPFDSFDTFIHLAPIVTLRGTKKCVDYYKMLYDELVGRVEKKVGAIPDERYRLLWDNLPIWYKIRDLSDKFASEGAALIVATYTNSWAPVEDNFLEKEPYRVLAEAYLKPYINMNIADRINYLVKMIEEFELDGMVIHSDRSCKPYSLGQYLICDEVTKRTGKPSLVIEADMNDPRSYSDAQINVRIEAFIETLGR